MGTRHSLQVTVLAPSDAFVHCDHFWMYLLRLIAQARTPFPILWGTILSQDSLDYQLIQSSFETTNPIHKLLLCIMMNCKTVINIKQHVSIVAWASCFFMANVGITKAGSVNNYPYPICQVISKACTFWLQTYIACTILTFFPACLPHSDPSIVHIFLIQAPSDKHSGHHWPLLPKHWEQQ